MDGSPHDDDAALTPRSDAHLRPGATAGLAMALGGLVGGSFFLWLASLRFIDPTEIGWVMKFDWATHYFGWTFFRLEPWHWPPGVVHGYNAPVGTAVGLTDSLPLMAYLLKPLSPWLPRDFQYLGGWEWLCYILQGALAARVASRFTPSVLLQVLVATVFVLMPVLLLRVAHAALMSHWLILWCLLIATRPPQARFDWREWAVIGVLAGMIQPYLAAMVAALLAGIAVGTSTLARRVGALAAAAVTMLAGGWLSGMFTLDDSSALMAFGLGTFSTNILAPISPYGWSRLLPEWPHATEGQLLEGTHYYGAGVLLLIVVAIAVSTTGRWRRPQPVPPRVFPPWLLVVAVVLTMIAISPRVTLGDRVLVDLTGDWAAPLALFRSTGRFLWPASYMISVWAVAAVLRRTTPRRAAAMLLVAIAVQAYDLADLHADRRAAAHNPVFYEWTNPFVSAKWPAIAVQYSHLVLAPPPQCGTSPVGSEAALWFGSRHGLTVNTGVLSRGSDEARARECRRLGAELVAGRLDPASLYLLTDAQLRSVPVRDDVVCGGLDGLVLCSAEASANAWRAIAAPIDGRISAPR